MVTTVRNKKMLVHVGEKADNLDSGDQKAEALW